MNQVSIIQAIVLGLVGCGFVIALAGNPELIEHFDLSDLMMAGLIGLMFLSSLFVSLPSDRRPAAAMQGRLVSAPVDRAEELQKILSVVPFSSAGNALQHEFRTPLHGLLAAAELLNETELTDEQRQYMKFIMSTSRQLAKVTDEVIDRALESSGMTGLDDSLLRIERDVAELFQHGKHSFHNISALKVLLVEDNAVNMTVMRIMLNKLGCRQVDIAMNGTQGVAKFGEGQHDVIFMDCEMPEMDGYAAAREIRRQPGGDHPVLVAVTANATEEERAQCLESGMDDFFTKPLSKARMAEILQRVAAQNPVATGSEVA